MYSVHIAIYTHAHIQKWKSSNTNETQKKKKNYALTLSTKYVIQGYSAIDAASMCAAARIRSFACLLIHSYAQSSTCSLARLCASSLISFVILFTTTNISLLVFYFVSFIYLFSFRCVSLGRVFHFFFRLLCRHTHTHSYISFSIVVCLGSSFPFIFPCMNGSSSLSLSRLM